MHPRFIFRETYLIISDGYIEKYHSVLWFFLKVKGILSCQTDKSIEIAAVDSIFDYITQYTFTKHLSFVGHVHFADYQMDSWTITTNQN